MSSLSRKRKFVDGGTEDVLRSLPPRIYRTPYMWFYRTRRLQLGIIPVGSVQQRSHMIAAECVKWKSISAEDKAAYLDLSEKDKQRYEAEMKEFKETGSFVVRDNVDGSLAKGSHAWMEMRQKVEKKDDDQSVELDDEDACVLCFEYLIATTFEPCGHKITCGRCSDKLKDGKCPICRVKIDKVS